MIEHGPESTQLAAPALSAKKAASGILTAITLACDLGALAISGSYAVSEVASLATAPAGGLVTFLEKTLDYYKTANGVENLISGIGFASTALNDLVNENTRVSVGSDGPTLVVGQDTVVSGAGFVLGVVPILQAGTARVPAEGIADTGINVLITAYDFGRVLSKIPTIFEVRIRIWPPKVEFGSPTTQ